jgi:vanillate O-demethylase monooxygenase subunit
MFLRNRWYVAAWDDEITDKPLARTLLNEPIVLYRTTDGTPVAFEDRCVHRRLPLSMGWVVGDALRCRYHGLTYDKTGKCIRIPGQDVIGDWARLRSYPVVQRHKWVLVWMGDPAQADESLIPDFHAPLDDQSWRHIKGMYHIPSNYKLLIDNLLDLSHIAYLHNTTIGNAVMADQAEVTYERVGEKVRVVRFMIDIPPSESFAEFGRYSGNIDRWQVGEFMPPAYFLINNGTDPAGKSNAPKDERVRGRGNWGFQVYHGITPESDTSTFQFWAIAHPREFIDPAKYEKFNRIFGKQVLEEDMEAYLGQHKALSIMSPELARTGEVNSLGEIRADVGLVMGRRMLEDLIAQEQESRRAAE